ncbi:MAG TPA: HAMP domain-containing sensor histidine kinase [Sandaracinaceae bacterium]
MRRVALASALAAAIGGASAALVSGTAATGLLAAREDEALRAAAHRLAREVEDEVEDELDEAEEGGLPIEAREGARRAAYREALADELDDVELPAARARIDDALGLVAGDGALPRARAGECSPGVLDGAPVRACTVALGSGTLTLATSASEAQARRPLFAWSALAGLLMGALLGGLASHRAAGWALGPLVELSDRVRRVRPDDPDPAVLEPPLEHAELEALRADITELLERLRDALSAARGFAARAAHELRTPLATIAGELELLAEQVGPEDAAAVTAARERVDDLVTLVERLLILAQPDPLAGSAETVDLADVLESVHGGLPAAARERIDARADEDAIVRGDAALLGALLSNAIDNALKFSSGPVAVRVARGGGEVRIEVEDGGPGIPKDELERVFAPFYRTAEARRSGALGHGVGLALIAHVARVHGGSARIESAPGEGTRLTVRLPAWAPRDAGGSSPELDLGAARTSRRSDESS